MSQEAESPTVEVTCSNTRSPTALPLSQPPAASVSLAVKEGTSGEWCGARYAHPGPPGGLSSCCPLFNGSPHGRRACGHVEGPWPGTSLSGRGRTSTWSHLDDSRTVSEDIATRSTCQLLHRHFHPYPTCELPPTTSSPPSPWQSVCHTPPCLPPIHLPALRLPPSGSSRPLTSPWLPSTTQRPDSGSPEDSLGSCQCPVNLFAALPAGPAVGLGNGVSLH